MVKFMTVLRPFYSQLAITDVSSRTSNNWKPSSHTTCWSLNICKTWSLSIYTARIWGGSIPHCEAEDAGETCLTIHVTHFCFKLTLEVEYSFDTYIVASATGFLGPSIKGIFIECTHGQVYHSVVTNQGLATIVRWHYISYLHSSVIGILLERRGIDTFGSELSYPWILYFLHKLC